METEQKPENPNIEYTYFLLCASCHYRFSIISEILDNTKLNLSKKYCPNCGKRKVQLDPSQFPSSKPSLESQRRLNIEASQISFRQATEQKMRDAEMGIGKETIVNPPLGESKPSFKIPEKVVESIREKVGGEIEKLLE